MSSIRSEEKEKKRWREGRERGNEGTKAGIIHVSPGCTNDTKRVEWLRQYI